MAALALHSLAAYGAYVWVTTSKSTKAEPVPVKALDQQEDSSHVFDEIARHYDRDIRTSEFFMGLPLLRWSMARRARVGFANWQPVWMATDGTTRERCWKRQRARVGIPNTTRCVAAVE